MNKPVANTNNSHVRYGQRASAPVVIEKNNSKVIDHKKEIYKELKEKGFHFKMDKETEKAIEEDKLKKYMNNLVKTHMQNVKADLSGKKEKFVSDKEDTIELDKKQVFTNECQIYGKDFMVNKIKEVYG
jgi:hypothetical protein